MEGIFDTKKVFGVKEGLDAAPGAPPTDTATSPEPRVSSTCSENLEPSGVTVAALLQQRSPAREDLQESRKHDRVAADSYRGNLLRALRADASGDSSDASHHSSAVDGSQSVAQALELNQPESGNRASSQRVAAAHQPLSGSSGGVSGVRRRGRKAERRGFLEIPSQSSPAAVKDRGDSGGGTCLCSATCWFACACVCHTATDVPAYVSEAGDVLPSSTLAPRAAEAVVINRVVRPLLANGVDTPANRYDDYASGVGVGGNRQAQLRQKEEEEEGEEGPPWVSGTSGNPVGYSEHFRDRSGTPGPAEATGVPPPVVLLAASEGAEVVATTDVGEESATSTRPVGDEQRPRRGGHGPSAVRARTAGEHTPGEHIRRERTPLEYTPRENTPDLQSAFLATSECVGGARAIRFGTATRFYRSVGLDSGGPSTSARKGEVCEGTGDTRWVGCYSDLAVCRWIRVHTQRGGGGGFSVL